VMRAGSNSEMSSVIAKEDADVIEEAPGVARDAEGPLVSPENYVVVDVPKVTTGTSANVPLRGVDASAVRVRDDVRIVAGRMFTPGLNELVVGRGAAEQFAGLTVGSTPQWGRTTWTVVGVFEAGGGLQESEIWADVRALQNVYNYTAYQVVRAKLTSPDAFQGFKDALTSDPRLDVTVERESDFYASQSEALSAPCSARSSRCTPPSRRARARSRRCARSASARCRSSSRCSRRGCCSARSAAASEG
jgi:putative ABC transport system permease protein